uniref:WH1 domain-containing protein n=1 Tax=Schistocephalus solidus TaxID=70667 RepID=A0A183SM62_SCHSO
LLSKDENQRLLASLGAKCVVNCAAVVCVYVPDGSISWRQIHCGVATIEKDSSRKSYFVRIYDMVKFSRLHEEIMFLEMGYTALIPNFHTFQGERSPMGLAFADVEEANTFQSHFGHLLNRWTRRLDTVTQSNKMMGLNHLQPAAERPFPSRLLSETDKRRLRACLGAKCVVVCAAVVCVHVPDGTDSWRQLYSGVATIEEDGSLESYFIRLYDLEKSSKLHEEAIFLEMQYTAVKPSFHILQGNRFPLGLAFADVEEASTFQSTFFGLLAKCSRKPVSVASNGDAEKPKITEINPMHVLELPVAEPAKSGFNLPSFRKKQKKSIVISAPTNFRHVQHMGFNKDSKQFDMSVLDEKMLQQFLKDNNLHCLFNSAEDTQFAVQFIAKNIGIKKVSHI